MVHLPSTHTGGGGGGDRDLETDDGSGLSPNRTEGHDNFSHIKDETSKMFQEFCCRELHIQIHVSKCTIIV